MANDCSVSSVMVAARTIPRQVVLNGACSEMSHSHEKVGADRLKSTSGADRFFAVNYQPARGRGHVDANSRRARHLSRSWFQRPLISIFSTKEAVAA
jgi:hypothetical protein